MRTFFVVAISLIFVMTLFEYSFSSTKLSVLDNAATAQYSNKNSNKKGGPKRNNSKPDKKAAKKPPVNTNKPGGPQKND